MKQNLFLAPATKPGRAYSHLQKSVIEGIKPHDAEFFPKDIENTVRVWGINSGLERPWKPAESGDWILFYTGDNEYGYAVQIESKEENPRLGSKIRSMYLDVSDKEEKEGKEWHFLFYLKDPLRIELSAVKLSEWLNYERAYRSRFQRVSEERLQAIEMRFDTLEEMVEEFIVNNN